MLYITAIKCERVYAFLQNKGLQHKQLIKNREKSMSCPWYDV